MPECVFDRYRIFAELTTRRELGVNPRLLQREWVFFFSARSSKLSATLGFDVFL